jgi:squalene synthase HpnC
MSDIAAAGSGKTHKDENFPVASVFIAPRHRAPILAFYDFVRAADDIADHATLSPDEKLAMLDRLEAALLGSGECISVAQTLRAALDARGLEPRHAQDLVAAFRRDVTQLRYRDWDDLIDYCRYSAMPVGRFVLDVHGENRATTWGPNDALCAALQIINHLQDCAKDYRDLDRVYLPQDALAAHGARTEMLSETRSPPELAAALRALTLRTSELLKKSAPFADLIADTRLAMEVGAIQRLAEKLVDRLAAADPLSENVHAGKSAFLLTALTGAGATLLRRLTMPRGRRASAAGVSR